MPAPDTPRDTILGTIRRAVATVRDETAARAAVEQRLAAPPRNLIPARGQVPPPQQVELFQRMATLVAATVEPVAEPGRVPHAVADYLSAHNLPARVRVAPDAALQAIPWDRRPTLEVGFGPARADDPVCVTAALAGVAETGSLLLASGADHAAPLAFLPHTHLVVLSAADIVGVYEEAWDRLRRRQADRGLGMPRAVTLVTGPSRTADIEQTSLLHAHGPGRLHIILVGPPAHGAEPLHG
ncbi:LutC/YkgG family protein [Oleisolibacter albus]|uniref:LutC/YkgG family protein n=1 Tax=Oleisolibacter albus TaxID=2171757 RepID=UPI001EFCAA42|nr:lactate utilization protein [Oleisolibacter albus]